MVLKISRKVCYVKPNVQSISYFNNGLSRMELSPKTIEDCLTKQLMLYIDGDVSKYEEINLRSIMYKALRRAKSQHRSFIQSTSYCGCVFPLRRLSDHQKVFRHK